LLALFAEIKATENTTAPTVATDAVAFSNVALERMLVILALVG